MRKTIEIPEGYEARIEGNKVILESKESEDERIIRTLKEIVNWGCAKNISVDNNVELKDCFAWLEKQGEYLKFRDKIQIGDKVTRNEDGVLVNLSQLNRVAKQGEQNLANSEKTCKDEQKPEIKKANDLRTWLYIVDKVLTEFQGIGQYLDSPICKEIANMLREEYCFDDTSSDWDRVYRKGLDAGEIYGYNKAKKEQKPAWSEKDEKMLKMIISDYTAASKSFCGHQGKLDFLKSLKERYTWKPSDEQMKALKNAAKHFGGCDPDDWDATLESLYNDLNKLKG